MSKAVEITTITQINWGPMGRELAHANSGQQAEFLAAFANAMAQFGTMDRALQINYITESLEELEDTKAYHQVTNLLKDLLEGLD